MVLFLKIPVNISCDIHTQKAYLAYLYLKKEFGASLPSVIRGHDRFFCAYWRKKLISRDWIRPDGSLQSYQYVWKSMGTQKVRRNKRSPRKHFRYVKFDSAIQSLSRKEFLVEVLRLIRIHLVERKKNQLALRLISRTFSSESQKKKYIRAMRKHETPEFSSIASAKLFGYKFTDSGSSSGLKYLNQYFKTHKGKLRVLLTPKNVKFFRYESTKISLV